MALTSHAELRRRLLIVLARAGGKLPRSEALDGMAARWDDSWTSDDLKPQASRPWETKWRNRSSFERDRMVKSGLLVHHTDGTWELTPEGWSAAHSAVSSRNEALERERARREALWQALIDAGGPSNVPAAVVRETGMYRGYRGVFADLRNTQSEAFPRGIAVTVLDLGKLYPNEMTTEGALYHFPSTDTPGRDKAEVESLRAAYETGLVVFVLTMAPNERRTVMRAYVEDLDADSGLALLTFSGDSTRPVPPPPEAEFNLTDNEDEAEVVWAKRRARPNQSRFAFDVMRRYGRRCAVCDLAVGVAIQAAHLRAKSRRGRDDARNGLPLCANHHLMFDRRLWTLNAYSGIVIHPDWTPEALGITRSSINHLKERPHPDALGDAWEQWMKEHPAASGTAS